MPALRQQIVIDYVKKGLREARSDIQKFSNESKKEINGLQRSVNLVGSFIKRAIAGVAVASFTALAAAIGKGTRAMANFRNDLAQVDTLLIGTGRSSREFEEGLIDIAVRRGRSLEELTSGLYQVISAGVDAADALRVLDVATQAAVGGGTDVATAVDGITTALNAFGIEASEAEKVSDSFFTAVAKGKTTFGELSSDIGRVAPLAAQLGISLEETLSGLSALTLGGLSTSESVSRLAAALNAFIANAEKFRDVGVDINAVIAKDGLQGAMEAVAKATGNSATEMQKLFGSSEALTAVLTLTGTQAQSFSSILDAMSNNAGTAASAFEKMASTTAVLTERLRARFNQILLQIGEKTLPLVNKGLESLLESMGAFDSPTRKLINSLRDLDGVDPEVIVQLEASEALREAREVRDELEKQINETEIKFDFSVKQERGGIISATFDRAQLADLNLDEARNQLAFVEFSIKRLAEAQLEAKKAGAELTGEQEIQIEALRQLQTSLSAGVALLEEYEAQTMVASRSLEDFIDRSSEAPEFKPPPPPQVEKAADIVIENLEKLKGAFLEFTPVEFITVLGGRLNDFNQQLIELENELFQGIISPEEYATRLDAISNTFLNELRAFRDKLQKQGLLTPQLEKVFNTTFSAASKGLKETGEEADKTSKSVASIVTAGRSVLQLTGVFDRLSDEMRDFAEGVLNVVDNFLRLAEIRQKLKDGGIGLGSSEGILAQALPTIGAAAGIAQLLGGLFKDQRRSMTELSRALRDNARSIRDSIDRLINDGVIGADVTGRQAERARELLDAFREDQEEIGDVGGLDDLGDKDERARFAKLNTAFQKFLANLDKLGIDLNLEAIGEFINLKLEEGLTLSEAIARALDDPSLGLAPVLDIVADDLGEYSENIRGAVEALRFFTQFLSDDASEQLRFFIDRLLALEELPTAADVADAIEADRDPDTLVDPRALFEEARGLDLNTAEGKARLEEIIQIIATALQSGNLVFGGLSPEDVRDILDNFQSIAEGIDLDPIVSGDGVDDFTKSVQIARSITEIQANELIAINESILFVLQQIRDRLLGGLSSGFGGYGKELPGSAFDFVNGSKPFNVNVGPINGLSESFIPQLMELIEDHLREAARGNNF